MDATFRFQLRAAFHHAAASCDPLENSAAAPFAESQSSAVLPTLQLSNQPLQNQQQQQQQQHYHHMGQNLDLVSPQLSPHVVQGQEHVGGKQARQRSEHLSQSSQASHVRMIIAGGDAQAAQEIDQWTMAPARIAPIDGGCVTDSDSRRADSHDDSAADYYYSRHGAQGAGAASVDRGGNTNQPGSRDLRDHLMTSFPPPSYPLSSAHLAHTMMRPPADSASQRHLEASVRHTPPQAHSALQHSALQHSPPMMHSLLKHSESEFRGDGLSAHGLLTQPVNVNAKARIMCATHMYAFM
ncbi:unnamed protein product [Closterium sp. Naga37s-1]|nr:unnamed protein product [Closterium sp. Naga37s-1]